MRLGLLGPSEGDVASLGRAAEFLLNSAKVNRAIYLGVDGALDRAVSAWARKLVGDDPSDDNAWKRAVEVAAKGGPGELDKFVQIERARLRLKALESLPEKVNRTIEMFGDRVAVLIHDKGALDEEDILAANILVFGKSDAPLIKRIGGRWFVTPGVIGAQGGGIAVIEDDQDDVVAAVYDGSGKQTQRATLTLQRAAKMRVQGGA
jgi:hypothetical protein